ncbi:GTPase [Candidatus Carsonella ruddii]|uniref:GTPase n=1 Tax=Carsonella ruddii TaxID=114186 RepID=UPI003D599886
MKKIIFSKINPDEYSSVNIIRISGYNVIKFINPLIKKKKLEVQKLTYTKLYDLKNNLLDNILIVYFKSPKSFTGEDVIELHYHGNNDLSKKIIKIISFMGGVQALPGEFLEKRYLHGKITLIECENINKNFFFQNEKNINKNLEFEKNIFLCAIKNLKFKFNMIILCLEISFINKKNSIIKDFIFIKFFLKKIIKLIKILIKKFNKIDYFKVKYDILIMGKRNVGKSTFYNKVCNNYASIITNISGTTKNIITKKILICKKNIIINDTAGLKRNTKDLVEKIGILKNIKKIHYSNLIFYMLDKFNLKNLFFNIPLNFLKQIKNSKLIIIINKCDLLNIKEGIYKIKNLIIIFLSAKKSILINKIKCFIYKSTKNKINNFHNKYTFILKKKCLFFYKNFFCSYDIILENILNFQKDMFKISGNYTNKNIINSIFRNFCIGK